MDNVERFVTFTKFTSKRLSTLFTLLIFILFTFIYYSCSDKNPDEREKSIETGGNDLSNDATQALNSVIENLKAQIAALPKIPYIAETINYQSLASREDLASKTIRELNDITRNLNDAKTGIKSELADLLEQWSDAATDLKSNLKDYESIRDESRRLKKNSDSQKGFSNKIFSDLEIEGRLNKQVGFIYASSSKLERLESELRYFNNN